MNIHRLEDYRLYCKVERTEEEQAVRGTRLDWHCISSSDAVGWHRLARAGTPPPHGGGILLAASLSSLASAPVSRLAASIQAFEGAFLNERREDVPDRRWRRPAPRPVLDDDALGDGLGLWPAGTVVDDAEDRRSEFVEVGRGVGHTPHDGRRRGRSTVSVLSLRLGGEFEFHLTRSPAADRRDARRRGVRRPTRRRHFGVPGYNQVTERTR